MSSITTAASASGTPLLSTQRSCARAARDRGRSRIHLPLPRRHQLDGRGLYRVSRDAEYRIYVSGVGPPGEGNPPGYTPAALPFEIPDAAVDATYWIAVSWFNGYLDSGFLPVGPSGERYVRVDIADGAALVLPPAAPLEWHLVVAAGGVVRVRAVYAESGSARATHWAIAYTSDGSDPPADTPDAVATMPSAGLAVVDYALPAAANGATVKVRLQTRRNDGTVLVPDYRYSEGSTILSTLADALGPTAPIGGARASEF